MRYPIVQAAWLAAVLLAGCSTTRLVAPQEPAPMPLWPGGAPGALGTADKDTPTLTAYFPPARIATGAAVVIFPGGGYGSLAPHEGVDYARWLTNQGIAGFVVKYRLGSSGYRHPRMLEDAARAVRLVRYHAAEWKVDAARIGIIGSSAGGHLAATLVTHYDDGNPAAADPIDRESCRPDLAVLCYAVITMGDETHKGSRNNLLGPTPDPALIDDLSNEKHVRPGGPPCFIFTTDEDKAVPAENSLSFAEALRKAGVSVELHMYEHGRHGIGLGSHPYDPAKWHPWTVECRRWLRERGFGPAEALKEKRKPSDTKKP